MEINADEDVWVTQSAHLCRGWSARPCRRRQRWESPQSRQRGRRYPCQSGTLERGDNIHGMWRRGQYYIFIEKSELLKIDRYGIGVNIYLFLFCDLIYYDNHNMPTKPPTSIKCMQFNFESSYNKATTKNITSSTTKSKLYWSKFQTYFVISNLTWPFPCKKKIIQQWRDDWCQAFWYTHVFERVIPTELFFVTSHNTRNWH